MKPFTVHHFCAFCAAVGLCFVGVALAADFASDNWPFAALMFAGLLGLHIGAIRRGRS